MRRTCSYILFFVLFTWNTSAIAQIDAAYIGSFEQDYSAKIYGGYSFTSLTRQYASSSAETYIPNVPPYLGLGGSWKGIGGSLSYGPKFANPHKKEERSDYLDLQFHYYGERFVFDFFGERYNGFSIQSDSVQQFYPDVGVVKLGGFAQYNFNYKRFSYSAAFDQSKKQLKSAGTPSVGLAFYFTKVEAPSLFIEERASHRTHILVGPSVGYAYTFVITDNYYATGSLSSGLHACIDTINNKGGICPAFYPRISSGYNAETWAVAFSAQYNVVYMSFAKADTLGLGTLDGQLAFVKRF